MNLEPSNQTARKSKVVFTMGGKGGVGKTTLLGSVAEYFASRKPPIPVHLLDLDTENKNQGSLSHFFPNAEKVNIHTRVGLDIFIDRAALHPLLLADMGGGSGKVSQDWFRTMYPLVKDSITFVAIAVVTSDPASVQSLLAWEAALGDKVTYLVVLNAGDQEEPDFQYWESSVEAIAFRDKYNPAVIRLESRIAKVQNALRNHGKTLTDVADYKVTLPDLDSRSTIGRAQLYRDQIFMELDQIKELLLP